jgi:Kdo2-lipid IVA lauroyltransferase/acyltransferase
VANQTPPSFSKFRAPRFWPTWLGIGALFVIAWLPFSWRMALGSVLGRLTYLFARERRYITTVNIKLCFPELDAASQAALIKRCFVENGIGLIETATGWMRPPSHFQHMVIFSGAEHLDAALAQGRGVLLLGAHYSTLDFSANLLSVPYPFGTTYRPHRNPLFDALMLRGRLRYCNGVFDRYDIRGAFRHLKQGKIVWYAPDQDYGPEQAVFAPFFGLPAATITATTRFAAINNSPVVMIRHHRLTNKQRYVLEFMPVTPPFPSGDDVADATRINQMLETAIRMDPAQYLWMHKRFKTQYFGKPQSPYIFIKTPTRKLSEALYAKLTDGAIPLSDPEHLQLTSGLQLWHYAGLPTGWKRQQHPLMLLDSYSKQLRASAVITVTVDSLFWLPFKQQCSATLHVPRGDVLTDNPAAATLTPQRAAKFLARIHAAGFHFQRMDTDNLLLHNNRLALLNPLVLAKVNAVKAGPRLRDLNALMDILHYSPLQQTQCQQEYLQRSPQAVAQGLLPPPRNQKISHE